MSEKILKATLGARIDPSLKEELSKEANLLEMTSSKYVESILLSRSSVKVNDEIKNHPLLQFFAYKHLSEELKEVSKPFSDLANKMLEDLPENPLVTMMLQELMKAKDSAVRAKLFKP